MLRSLTLRQCFTHRDRTFEFARGLTAITGPNESGKSLVVEMIRYALFGSQALRGATEDYKKVEVLLTFDLQGERYTVRRRGNRARLMRRSDPLADGIRPVNAAIRRLLGYDMMVFDTANACNQGQIEALGAMTPTQRKQMVDQTVGLSVMEQVGQWTQEQARLHDREAEAIARVIVAPTPPEAPSDFAPSAELAETRQKLMQQAAARAELTGWLAREESAPEAPTCLVEEPVSVLEAAVQARSEAQARLQSAEGQLALLPEPTLSADQVEAGEAAWSAWHASVEKRRALAGLEAPALSLEIIEATREAWAAHRRWLYKADLLAKGEHTCPSCGHNWPKAGDELSDLDAVEPTPEPEISEGRLRRETALHQEWAQSAELRARFTDVPDDPGRPEVTEATLREARAALAGAERREALIIERTTALEALEALPDRRADLEARRAYEVELTLYAERSARYAAWISERTEKQAQLAALASVPLQLEIIERRWREATLYEQALARYTAEQARYEAAREELQARQAEALGWRAARAALTELRTRIKGFLLPSLNAVASRLLHEMTGGVRGVVQVDEQFGIQVDGQSLDTLSGSAKAVANLALRLGLGQVLTHRVFPVFLADEVDAAMDADRAGFTAEAFQRLTGSLDQIILISHKSLDADHVIEL